MSRIHSPTLYMYIHVLSLVLSPRETSTRWIARQIRYGAFSFRARQPLSYRTTHSHRRRSEVKVSRCADAPGADAGSIIHAASVSLRGFLQWVVSDVGTSVWWNGRKVRIWYFIVSITLIFEIVTEFHGNRMTTAAPFSGHSAQLRDWRALVNGTSLHYSVAGYPRDFKIRNVDRA